MNSLALCFMLQATVLAGGPQDSANVSYRQAYHQTIETGQPLVILVGADWCPGCQTMKHSVIPALRHQGSLKDVSFAVVNSDQQSRLASQLMSGGSIPQLITYRKSADGWKRTQLTGAHSVGEVQSFIHRAVELTAAERERESTTIRTSASSPSTK
ncbi:MAG: thioredoxin family protein [Pirellulales bacterium]